MRLVNFEAMHKAIGLRINPKAPCSPKLLIGLYVVSVFTLFQTVLNLHMTCSFLHHQQQKVRGKQQH